MVGLLHDVRFAKRWFHSFPGFYARTLEHMQALDGLAFASSGISEHPFDEDGYARSKLAYTDRAC